MNWGVGEGVIRLGLHPLTRYATDVGRGGWVLRDGFELFILQ